MLLSLIAVLSLAAITGGCGSSSSSSATASGPSSSSSSGSGATKAHFIKKSPLTIGYSVFDLKQQFFQFYVKGIQAAAKKYGFTSVLVSNEASSAQTQVTGSEQLVSRGISALIISPTLPSALPAEETVAHNAHIPVIIGDVGTGTSPNYDAYVISDNCKGGQLAAGYIATRLKGKPGVQQVAVVSLLPTSGVLPTRGGCFKSQIKEDPKLSLVADVSGQETVEGGYNAMQQILASHPHLAAVYAENGPMDEGAARALRQAGKNGAVSPILVGFNGDPPSLTLVKNHQEAANIAQNPYAAGYEDVIIAHDLLNGISVPFTDSATREYNIPVHLVTAANVETFINGLKTGQLY